MNENKNGVSLEWLETIEDYGYSGDNPSVHGQIDKFIEASDKSILKTISPKVNMLMSLLKMYNDGKLQEEAFDKDYSGQTMEQFPSSPAQGVGPQTFENSPSFGLDYQTDYSGEKIPRKQLFKDMAVRDSLAGVEPAEEDNNMLQAIINKLMGQ